MDESAPRAALFANLGHDLQIIHFNKKQYVVVNIQTNMEFNLIN